MAAISSVYLVVSYFLIGFRPEQLFLVILCNFLFFASMATRRFVTAFSIFVVYWIIFDYMKAFPNYRFNTVHVESIYNAEKNIFGITQADGKIITPNEYWQMHQYKFLDFMAGIFYLCWIPVPLLFAFYLYIKNRRYYFYFAFTFLLVNLMGFVIYYSYPAAPPWYVSNYGFVFNDKTPGNIAGLGRFDELVGVHVFQSIYTKGSNIFAAMPSLHSAYPVVVFYYAVKAKLTYMRFVLGMVVCGIWFSAVYTNHHYILDVIAGLLCAVIGIWLFNLVGNKLIPQKKFMPVA
jgi:inositol phosphorylceramide synthase catalytic subunit